MASPCNNSPDEVISKIVNAKANADKFDKFVNGTDTQTVQLGTGSPTPTIRNAVRQIKADGEWIKQFIADAPEGDVSLNNVTALNSIASRTLTERFSDIANIKDFGAVGDAVTDDTAAIQAALNSSSKCIYFPEGTYRIVNPLGSTSPVLTSSVDGRHFWGCGILTATEQVIDLISVTGADNDIQINVDGNGYIGTAIKLLNATGANVHDCHIKNLNGLSNNKAVGVYASYTSDASFWIHDNIFEDFDAVGDGTATNGIGMCRGVAVGFTHVNTKPCIIENNVFRNIFGEEGDCITINSEANGEFFDASTVIRNNSFHRWSRRAVKLQGGYNVVFGNTFKNDIQSSDIQSYWTGLSSSLVVYEGKRNIIKGNTFIDCNFYNEINVHFTLENESGEDTQIVENTIISNDDTSCIYVGNKNLSNVCVSRNTIIAPNATNRILLCSHIEKLTVADNNIVVSESSTTQPIFISYCQNAFVKNNSAYTGANSILSIDNSADVKQIGNNISNIVPNGNCREVFFDNNGDLNVSLYGNGKTLMLTQPVGSNPTGARLARIACKQNDESHLNTVCAAIDFVAIGTTGNACIDFCVNREMTTGSLVADKKVRINMHGQILPVSEDTENTTKQTIGTSNTPWEGVYANTGSISLSDAREKTNISSPNDALMRAWGHVNFKIFQFRKSLEEKGENARQHVGIIAQQIQESFAAEGLDAARYGLFCYDAWEDEWETFEVVDAEPVYDDEGHEVSARQTHIEQRLVKAAGDRFSIRYEEALALECAYQRWLGEKRDARIAELEARLNKLSGNGTAPSGALPNNI